MSVPELLDVGFSNRSLLEASMNKAKVMICEDDALLALELEYRVTELGYEVIGTASDSERAFELANRGRPDLALMDVHLNGGMLGTEIAKLLRKEYDIASIFISGSAEAGTVHDAVESKPLAYLVKPVQDHELSLSLRCGVEQVRERRNLEQELAAEITDSENARNVLLEFRSTLTSEARMRGLQEIIGGIADHFNNALFALSLPLDILREHGGLKPFELRQVEQMATRHESEKVFMRRLLWASGTGGLELASCSVQELIREVLSKFSPTLPTGVAILTELNEASPSQFVDRNALGLAITNVLANAIEAVGELGEISIRSREVYAGGLIPYNSKAKAGRYLEIAITDSGRGISPETIPRVAEPFFTTHTDRVAPGLGLTQAYGILQSHGGWLSIASIEEMGTAVRLYLPINIQSRSDSSGNPHASRTTHAGEGVSQVLRPSKPSP